MPHVVPTGMKALSSVFIMREITTQGAANAFNQVTINTGIVAINREALLIWEVDLALSAPDIAAIPPAGARVIANTVAQVTDRSQAAIVEINDTSCIARRTILLYHNANAAGNDVVSMGLSASSNPVTVTDTQRDIPIAIVTNDEMFLACDGSLNAFVHNAILRMYVQRVQIDTAGLYAALIEQRLP